LLERAKTAKRESKYVGFKEKFDIYSSQDWCEIIKDIVAMYNFPQILDNMLSL